LAAVDAVNNKQFCLIGLFLPLGVWNKLCFCQTLQLHQNYFLIRVCAADSLIIFILSTVYRRTFNGLCAVLKQTVLATHLVGMAEISANLRAPVSGTHCRNGRHTTF